MIRPGIFNLSAANAIAAAHASAHALAANKRRGLSNKRTGD